MSDRPTNSDDGLILVVQVSSALSLATLAGLLCSVKSVTPRIQFSFSWVSVIAFLLAGVVSVSFWHLVFRLSENQAQSGENQQRQRKIWLGALGSILAVGLIVAFLYPLKDFGREKQREIGLGAVSAVVFLSVLGLMLWKVVRFLEKDSKR